MKTLIAWLTFAALAAVLCIIACRTIQFEPTEATLVADEMERAYGNDWVERLLAAGTTNKAAQVEMLTAYYEAVDACANHRARPTNWVGQDYLLRD